MTEDEIRKVLQEELGNIAPEMDIAKLDATADLREALDIDSIDFLNFVTALHKRLGIELRISMSRWIRMSVTPPK